MAAGGGLPRFSPHDASTSPAVIPASTRRTEEFIVGMMQLAAPAGDKTGGLARVARQAAKTVLYNRRMRKKLVVLFGSWPPGVTRVLVLSGVIAVVPAAPAIDP